MVSLKSRFAQSRATVRCGGRATTTEGDLRMYMHPEYGVEFPSITSILSAVDEKPQIARWYGKIAAETAIRNMGELQSIIETQGTAVAVKHVIAEAELTRAVAADAGSYVHAYAEALITGGQLAPIPSHVLDRNHVLDGNPVVLTTEFMRAWCAGFDNFVQDFDPIIEYVESPVYSLRHSYAGRIDLIARLHDNAPLSIIDIKTSSLIHREVGMQLSAAIHADQIGDGEQLTAMPEIRDGYVLHIRPGKYRRGYKLTRVDVSDRVFNEFKIAANLVNARIAAEKQWSTTVTYPPGCEGDVMIEDSGLRARKALMAAFPDVSWMSELKEIGVDALSAAPRIGKKTVETVMAWGEN